MNSDRIEFTEAMSRCAVSTRTDLTEADFDVYWDRFNSWDLEDFKTAMQRCADEIGRFPSVSQVRDAFPKRQQTADDLEPYQPLIGVQEDDSEKGPDSLEEFIDSMTDEQLEEIVFRPMLEDSTTCLTPSQKKQAIDFSIKQFRKHPFGRMYRSVVRDEVWKKRAIYLPTVSETPF